MRKCLYDVQRAINSKHSLTAIPQLKFALRCPYSTTIDPYHSLDPISEVHILLVRQVTKSLQGLDLSISDQACSISSLVLHITHRGIHGLEAGCNAVRNE